MPDARYTDDQHFRVIDLGFDRVRRPHQNVDPGVARKAISSGVDARPRIALR